MRLLFFIATSLLCFYWGIAQSDSTNIFTAKKLAVKDSVSIKDLYAQHHHGIRIKDVTGKKIDSSLYRLDRSKSKIYFSSSIKAQDSVIVEYIKYPEFLTKPYSYLDEKLIFAARKNKRYQLQPSNTNTIGQIFDGLNTRGSISRGITIGNNQNSVLNSELDLQISGKLSDKVTIRASMQDSNVPIQADGFSQSLDEFDQIFIELEASNWKVRAGDIQISENESQFASFTKKLQGLSITTKFEGTNNTTKAFASGALVRGIFNQSNFNGQEGNQGPYKLVGQNGELFVLIVSGSEKVYVNGLLLKRGESNDYVIDYNAGEIRFTPTFPITADMRIAVQYQVSQRNFSRVLGNGGVSISNDKFELSTFVYTENDLRNQTLQQELSDAQKEVLSEAGDNPENMIASSAIEEEFSEDGIFYINNGTLEAPEFQFWEENEAPVNNRPLFQVRFSNVGENNGSYVLRTRASSNGNLVVRNTVSSIYDYVGPNMGNFEPVTQLQAPTKLQLGVIRGNYTPKSHHKFSFEIAASNNDLNLFSSIDDTNNTGAALQVKAHHPIKKVTKESWNVFFDNSVDYIQENFRNVEQTYNIEFNRDWNLPILTRQQNQLLTTSGVEIKKDSIGTIVFNNEYLSLSKDYQGTRQNLFANFNLKNWIIQQHTSYLNTDATETESNFLRNQSTVTYAKNKYWSSIKYSTESNQSKNKATRDFNDISQAFRNYEWQGGIGDSTAVFLKLGARYRENDSLQNKSLINVAKSQTYTLHTRPFNNQKQQLDLFANYRILNRVIEKKSENTLTSRVNYQRRFWKGSIDSSTLLEIQNGSVPQQDFTYVEVDAGQGQYTWIDYNQNGVQEFEEFELSPFPDQATFVRVLLPRQRFLKTTQNKISQQLNINFSRWKKSKNKLEKFFSHFGNQSNLIIDRSILSSENDVIFHLFRNSNEAININTSFRNSLFFNRGKQHFTNTYTYNTSENSNTFITGQQATSITRHQHNFSHKIKESWLLELESEYAKNGSEFESFSERNFDINTIRTAPKLSYLFSKRTSLGLTYSYQDKQNVSGNEALNQQNLTLEFKVAQKQKSALNFTASYISNQFNGNAFTPVGFQLLEGLQSGKNYTWNVLTQKKITKFLELNIDYRGRKSNDAKTIHTGSVQVRAFF